MGVDGAADGLPFGLTVRDLCDLVYAEHIARLERRVMAERQIAAVLLAAGAKDVPMPTMAQSRDEFDAALLDPPLVLDQTEVAWLQLMEAS